MSIYLDPKFCFLVAPEPYLPCITSNASCKLLFLDISAFADVLVVLLGSIYLILYASQTPLAIASPIVSTFSIIHFAISALS